ncbi:hypothetical protein NKG05_24415 [Oerskovia sp. M15]
MSDQHGSNMQPVRPLTRREIREREAAAAEQVAAAAAPPAPAGGYSPPPRPAPAAPPPSRRSLRDDSSPTAADAYPSQAPVVRPPSMTGGMRGSTRRAAHPDPGDRGAGGDPSAAVTSCRTDPRPAEHACPVDVPSPFGAATPQRTPAAQQAPVPVPQQAPARRPILPQPGARAGALAVPARAAGNAGARVRVLTDPAVGDTSSGGNPAPAPAPLPWQQAVAPTAPATAPAAPSPVREQRARLSRGRP